MISQRKYDALVAENQELKSKLETILGARLPGRATMIKAAINKIKADAIREAIRANKKKGYTDDFYGAVTTYDKVEYDDLLNYARRLESEE